MSGTIGRNRNVAANRIKMGKTLLILLAILAVSDTHAEACTYDQDVQLQKLQEIAQQQNAELDRSGRKLTWSEPDGSRVELSYGGCDHLAFTVRMTLVESPVKDGTPVMDEAKAMRTAASMAERFWDNVEYALLKTGLESDQVEREQMADKILIELPAEHYSEFYIEYSPSARFVEIAWVRNF